MSFYLLLLHLGGAIALLLFAVRMVRTGVQRSQEPALRAALRDSKGGRLRAAAIGAGVALAIQSSTAVGVLAQGFATTGALSLETGLALMLGAYLGSALVVLALSFDLSLLVPVLLIIGATLFLKGTAREPKQFGRILIGIALTLISLQMVGQATEPLRNAGALPAIVSYLSGDFVSAFLIGAAFTWLVHSSVGSTLLIVALSGAGLVPLELGVSLMLGANLGGTLIGFGLSRLASPEARRLALGPIVFRGVAALVALLAFHLLHLAPLVPHLSVGQQVIGLHVLFNLAVMLLGLPLCGVVARLLERHITAFSSADTLNPLAEATSCLDQAVVGVPALALASATRELLRMAEIIERMLQPLMELYETGDPEKIRQARRLEQAVNQAQSEIKLYLAKIDYAGEPEAQRVHELSSFAINLEYVGDAITKTLLKLAETRRDQKLSFSPEGWRELNELHHRVMANMQLALNVLVSKDRESARQLLVEKDAMRSAERDSYRQHLGRLRTGAAESIATSNIHLETVRALKTINSLFASVAYPILAETGDLLDSRLASRS